jgi:hypothetical protein
MYTDGIHASQESYKYLAGNRDKINENHYPSLMILILLLMKD